MIRRFDQDPNYQPRRGRTKQTFLALLQKRALRIEPGGKVVLLVRLK
jgi:hypothetical protein